MRRLALVRGVNLGQFRLLSLLASYIVGVNIAWLKQLLGLAAACLDKQQLRHHIHLEFPHFLYRMLYNLVSYIRSLGIDKFYKYFIFQT